MVDGLTGLKELSLERCNGLGSIALLQLLHLTDLRCLSLVSCPEVTEAGVLPLATLPKLEVLSVHQCAHVGKGLEGTVGMTRRGRKNLKVDWMP